MFSFFVEMRGFDMACGGCVVILLGDGGSRFEV